MDTIGPLAAEIAHDFNNLLLIIRGYSRMLMKRLEGEELGFVQEIDCAAVRAGEFTKQLTSFSHQQALCLPAPRAPIESLVGDEVVLVVEDAGIVRTLVIATLESYGYDVMGASCAEEAIALAAQADGSIDLLMTDIVMPGMNGSELAKTLVGAYPGLRVLLTSGYPANTLVADRTAHAREAFIEKPYMPDELARKVREVLDEPRPRCDGP